MSGLDADTRLRRALATAALRADAAMTVVRSDAIGWSSATFNGARHTVELAGRADEATEHWLADLPEAELAMAGHLVADLKIVAMRQAGEALSVTLEVLTVEDR